MHKFCVSPGHFYGDSFNHFPHPPASFASNFSSCIFGMTLQIPPKVCINVIIFINGSSHHHEIMLRLCRLQTLYDQGFSSSLVWHSQYCATKMTKQWTEHYSIGYNLDLLKRMELEVQQAGLLLLFRNTQQGSNDYA